MKTTQKEISSELQQPKTSQSNLKGDIKQA